MHLQQRMHFGAITNGEMRLNECGKIVDNEWLKTPTIRQYVLLDKYIIMPNHVHGIIIIDNVNICRDTAPVSRVQPWRLQNHASPVSLRLNNLEGQHHIRSRQLFVHSRPQQQNKYVKSKKPTPGGMATTILRAYYRNPHELDQTREYIIYNPLKWALDSENPDNKSEST